MNVNLSTRQNVISVNGQQQNKRWLKRWEVLVHVTKKSGLRVLEL